MTDLRIALVTRRYWPLTGDCESVVSNLAVELARQGAKPTIVSGQWSPDWSTSIVHREIPVVRIAQARSSGWGAFWYMTALSRWLRGHRHELDLVCVSRLRYDAYAAVGALRRSGLPVILRAEEGGPGGDCAWQQETLTGKRIQRRCLLADAIIAPSEAIERELRDAGYPRERIHLIGNGIPPAPAAGLAAKAAARRALAEVNHDLSAADAALVAVCVERFQRHNGLFELIQAWEQIADDWPHAQLWMIGDGPERTALYEQLVQRGLHHQVRLPGSFDDLEDVLAAADVFIAPAPEASLSYSLLQALAAGVPTVAADTPDHRRLLASGTNGVLARAGDAAALAAAIAGLFREASPIAAQSAARPRRLGDGWSLVQMAGEHLQLFQQLAARRDVISA